MGISFKIEYYKMKGSRRQKNCSECGRNIAHQNKSELCNSCYNIFWKKEKRNKQKKNHFCIACGKKVECINGKYLVRCNKCREKQRIYNAKRKREKEHKKVEDKGKQKTSI